MERSILASASIMVSPPIAQLQNLTFVVDHNIHSRLSKILVSCIRVRRLSHNQVFSSSCLSSDCIRIRKIDMGWVQVGTLLVLVQTHRAFKAVTKSSMSKHGGSEVSNWKKVDFHEDQSTCRPNAYVNRWKNKSQVDWCSITYWWNPAALVVLLVLTVSFASGEANDFWNEQAGSVT